MTENIKPQVQFEGEEAGAGYIPPIFDLIAAGFLSALAILVIAASVALPVPGDLVTAPGLLPLLVGASLLLMAIGLGVSAIKRRSTHVQIDVFSDLDLSTERKTLALAIAVAVYIAALENLAFRYDVVVGGFRHSFSAFEPVTILILTVIIQMSWRGPLWITVGVSMLWTVILSGVFQHVFKIPLPGTF